MRSLFSKLADGLASSYWFVPGVMAFCAFLFAIYLTQSSVIGTFELLPMLQWIRYMEPEGARTLMATIAGSMITVAGVTFSITISSIVHASSQFGPRLLSNFMQDAGNQFTLGTFIATFLYCLVVLSSITGNPGSSDPEAVFVPHIAVLLGVAMAVASTLVLIYFLHHVPASIRASHVISTIGRQLIAKIEDYFEDIDEAQQPSGEEVARQLTVQSLENVRPIRSTFSGYVQFLDSEVLSQLATELDVLIVLNAKPGDFVSRGDFLAWVDNSPGVDAEVEATINGAFLYGDIRTAAQDVLFLANELVEISARALSPGINDPFTANMCIDWLGSSFARIMGSYSSQYSIKDEQGNLRLLVPTIDSKEYVLSTLDKIASYVVKDRNSALHMQAMIGRLMVNNGCTELLTELQQYSRALAQRAASYIDETDVQLMLARAKVIQEISTDTARNAEICRAHHWLGGSY